MKARGIAEHLSDATLGFDEQQRGAPTERPVVLASVRAGPSVGLSEACLGRASLRGVVLRRFGPGVGLVVGVAHPLGGQMRVHLGGGQRLMSEQLLH